MILRLRPIDPLLEFPNPDNVLGWLEANTQLIGVVGALQVEAMQIRPDDRAENRVPGGRFAVAVHVVGGNGSLHWDEVKAVALGSTRTAIASTPNRAAIASRSGSLMRSVSMTIRSCSGSGPAV